MTNTQTIRIVPMKPSHAPAVARMMRRLAAFHGDKTKCTPDLILRSATGRGRVTDILVALRDGEPVAFIEYHRIANFRRGFMQMRIDYLYVEESLRRMGIARKLIAQVTERALAAGRQSLSIGADPKNKTSNACYNGIGLPFSSQAHTDYKGDKKWMRTLLKGVNKNGCKKQPTSAQTPCSTKCSRKAGK